MNIIEAIKSGKRIKRSMWPEFKHYENHYGAKYTAREDILADDWEVENVGVTINTDEFYSAYRRAVIKSFELPFDSVQTMADLIAEQLGL